jgi:hypothetical protein
MVQGRLIPGDFKKESLYTRPSLEQEGLYIDLPSRQGMQPLMLDSPAKIHFYEVAMDFYSYIEDYQREYWPNWSPDASEEQFHHWAGEMIEILDYIRSISGDFSKPPASQWYRRLQEHLKTYFAGRSQGAKDIPKTGE